MTGAGTALKRRDGLNIAGGLVNIMVTSGQAPTAFNNNTQHGIYVTGAAVINITGFPVTVPAPNGQGTVVANGNALAGLRIFEAPGNAAFSTVNGLVAWQNAQNGLRLYGGGKVKVRNSVFLANVLNGVYVTPYEATSAGNDLSQLDLGTAADPGRNTMQAALGSMPNLAGLCLGMTPGLNMALTLSARGNIFAGPTDCATSTAAIVRSTVCNGFADIGVVPERGHGGDGRRRHLPVGSDAARRVRAENAPVEAHALSCNSDPSPLGSGPKRDGVTSARSARWRREIRRQEERRRRWPRGQRGGGGGRRRRRADAAGRCVAGRRGAAPLPQLRGQRHHLARAARRARRPEAGAAPHPLRDVREPAPHPDGKHRKCATIVGEVMGKYHPHGDTSFYDALVRMAQDFSLRYPLVDGHGNFGSLDGDAAAAYRYTECRLAPLADRAARRARARRRSTSAPNYDGTHRRADRPAGAVPALLSTARTGIAVGMATNIPPHNLSEVVRRAASR